jgi:hypothetical protein
MREHPLCVPPDLWLRAKRTPSPSQPRPLTPHEWWGIALTNVVGHGFGGVSIVVLLDW